MSEIYYTLKFLKKIKFRWMKSCSECVCNKQDKPIDRFKNNNILNLHIWNKFFSIAVTRDNYVSFIGLT